jgi:Flp pilus assembly protein TadG
VSALAILRSGARDGRGATVVEFAILAPALIGLTVGVIHLGLMMLTVTSLHYATEAAARCASVQTTVCTDPASITSEAMNRYNGPDVDPVFSYLDDACGNRVTGSATYVLNAVIYQVSVPLSATACFP